MLEGREEEEEEGTGNHHDVRGKYGVIMTRERRGGEKEWGSQRWRRNEREIKVVE